MPANSNKQLMLNEHTQSDGFTLVAFCISAFWSIGWKSERNINVFHTFTKCNNKLYLQHFDLQRYILFIPEFRVIFQILLAT